MNKKYLFPWLAVLVFGLLSFSLASCNNDDESEEEQKNVELAGMLQGTWVFEKGTAGKDQDGNDQELDTPTLNFIENALELVVASEVKLETLTFTGDEVNGIKYTLKEGKYIILEGMEKVSNVTIEITDITSTTLRLHAGANLLVKTEADLEYNKKVEAEEEEVIEEEGSDT